MLMLPLALALARTLHNLAVWALARSLHTGTPGARHRRFRGRAGADDREQDRQGAEPDAAFSSAPVLVPLIPQPPTPLNQRREL